MTLSLSLQLLVTSVMQLVLRGHSFFVTLFNDLLVETSFQCSLECHWDMNIDETSVVLVLSQRGGLIWSCQAVWGTL